MYCYYTILTMVISQIYVLALLVIKQNNNCLLLLLVFCILVWICVYMYVSVCMSVCNATANNGLMDLKFGFILTNLQSSIFSLYPV